MRYIVWDTPPRNEYEQAWRDRVEELFAQWLMCMTDELDNPMPADEPIQVRSRDDG